MNPYWIVVGFSGIVQFVVFLRWLHRRERDDEMRRAFLRDLALIHLPYLNHALRLLGTRLGIELPEAPAVLFVELGNNDRIDRY